MIRLRKAEFATSLKDMLEDTEFVDYPDYEDPDYENQKRDNDDASEDLPRDYFDYDDSSISIRPCRPTCHRPYVCDTRHGYCVNQSHKITKDPKS
ncbi:hypothetical protein Ddc_17579 [Ditylenchus destructor]|nr:hypothetical protein Ddc_17579 [Ditylenchus destructor]